jgi:hypothetical protein
MRDMLAQSFSYACVVIAAMIVCLPFPWWYLWHRRRQRRKGWAQHRCGACGFTYTGPPEDNLCPECGQTLARSDTPKNDVLD